MDLGLSGRCYIVTGASTGLGYASAKALVAEDAKVVLSSRGKTGLDRACASLKGPTVGVAADNAEPAAARSVVGAAMEAFGQLDGILISVGGPPKGSVMETSEETWRDSFESIFLGGLRLAKAAATVMGGSGTIAFVLSTSVKQPIQGLAVSNGLRPGLAMLAKTLADELGPRGIRVLGIAPGRIETDRTREVDAGDPGARHRSEAQIPLRRLGSPDEFGRVAAFLLSPAASYMTGTVVFVDGGMSRAL